MRNDKGRTFLSFVRRLAIVVVVCLVRWFASLIQSSCKDGVYEDISQSTMA